MFVFFFVILSLYLVGNKSEAFFKIGELSFPSSESWDFSCMVRLSSAPEKRLLSSLFNWRVPLILDYGREKV